MRKAICPKQRLASTLRFIVTGESFCSLKYQSRISRKAVSYIIDEFCKVIVTVLSGTYLKFPSFKEKWNFPHCIGAVYGKHIVNIGCGMGSQYYNYKGTNSIFLLVAPGSNYEVTWANVGMNGRISDGGVLKRSKLGQMLEEGSLNLPAPEPLPGRSVPTPYVFIGDNGFTLQPNFMKPFLRKNLDLFTRICNCRFSRGRRILENVFGIKTNRWRVYRSPNSLHSEKAYNGSFNIT